MDTKIAVQQASDASLLRVFAVLTHRLHAAERPGGPRNPDWGENVRSIREQRDRVEAEILERMRR